MRFLPSFCLRREFIYLKYWRKPEGFMKAVKPRGLTLPQFLTLILLNSTQSINDETKKAKQTKNRTFYFGGKKKKKKTTSFLFFQKTKKKQKKKQLLFLKKKKKSVLHQLRCIISLLDYCVLKKTFCFREKNNSFDSSRSFLNGCVTPIQKKKS